MKKIIVNADDYGVVPSINEAITEAVVAGKVNSVAAFANYRDSVKNAQSLVGQAATANKGLDLGAHLTISSGAPVLEEAKNPGYGLCDANGNFKSFTELSNAKIDPVMLQKELLAQVERFTSNGVPVKHLSCHHNTLTCFEKLFRVYVTVAQETQLKMRSVAIEPVKKNNMYVKLFLGVSLRDDNDKDDMKAMRRFLTEIGGRFTEYSNNLVRTPGYLESAYYGPIPQIPIRKSALSKQIKDKQADLEDIVKRFGTSQNATTMELMVHLRKGDVALWGHYEDEVKATGYHGIDPKYFDSRVVEFQSLMQSDITGLFGTHGASYGSWEEL
jgi:predicted glycoside hydrolase/deacetylase ChbG (UPF0249 family)